jgi:hypothetical protein
VSSSSVFQAPFSTAEAAAPRATAPRAATVAAEKPKRAAKPKGEVAVDTAKDKALLHAFSAAIASAMQQSS